MNALPTPWVIDLPPIFFTEKWKRTSTYSASIGVVVEMTGEARLEVEGRFPISSIGVDADNRPHFTRYDGTGNDGGLYRLVRHPMYATDLLLRVGLKGHEYKKANQMSGGQQQRVAIARALSRSPRLILADEPTGKLDTHTADDIFALLREFNRQTNCACLIVTHDPRLAARCDRIVRLVDGRIADDGPAR